jgi:PAS domain S-box-containing protein
MRNRIPILRNLRAWLQPYVISVLGLGLTMGAVAIAEQSFGSVLPLPVTILLGLAFLLVFLCSAWLSYGSGILVSLAIALTGPHILIINRVNTSHPDLVRLLLVGVVSLVVSYFGSIHRRREFELRRHAEELGLQVRQHTDELLVSALEKRQAEDRLRFVLDSAEVGYWDFDIAAGVMTRSPTHDRVFGYEQPREHWDYRSFLRHVHPQDRARVEREVRAARVESSRAFEFRIIRADGKIRWLLAKVQTHAGSDGNLAHIGGVLVDVTARRRAEDDLREQAQLVDLAHDAIVTLDCDHRICFWSRGAERLYGYSREEALGRSAPELLQTTFPDSLDSIEKTAAQHGHWEGELKEKRKDGSQLVVASHWALWLASNGEKLGFLEINSDITEQTRIEEQLRHTQKLESLGVLAGGVAHDFNNILTGILGNSSLALDRMPEGHPTRVLIEDVMRAAERAGDLTRQLLAYAGKGRFVMRNIDLASLVKEISGLVRTSIPKGVQLRLQLDESSSGVFADPGQMQQIVMNLVINAAEAIGPEGGTVLVHTGLQRVDQQYIDTMNGAGDLLKPGEYAMLEVHDSGCGMDEETVKKIFDPFFTTKFAGRGLGLSAVLGIVRAHKGALKVYSQPGRGTTFKLLFPVCTESAAHEPAAQARDLAGGGIVLVVDDEASVRSVAKHTLEHYGYRILLAGDGRQAVEIYRRNPGIALVLLDLTMPVMNGEEALRQLQTFDPEVRVLLTSGYNEIEAVQRFAGKGLAGFIQKPYTAAGLAEKVKQAMVRRVRSAGA